VDAYETRSARSSYFAFTVPPRLLRSHCHLSGQAARLDHPVHTRPVQWTDPISSVEMTERPPATPSNALSAAMLAAAVLLIGACSGPERPSPTLNQASVDFDLLLTLPERPISFVDEVQPVLNNRCVVCHGCWDAPCQLKLSSHAGLERGASPERVYNGARITAMQPTRLYIDAKTATQWRDKGFHTVINERPPDDPNDPEQNLRNSVLYQMLRLKQLNPQPNTGMLSDDIDLSLDRKQVCVKEDEFTSFARRHPHWGMPFAMPNLSQSEYGVLVQWLAQGAKEPPPADPSAAAAAQIEQWERFLNGPSNREQLMSRYLYEHLFLGHLHFDGTEDREFYRLVRSYTPPGEPVNEIATVRPFDDPGTDTFYYRLLRFQSSIVAKAHVVYRLSPDRMTRYRELFLDPDYKVAELPSYEPQIASNPFRVFDPIPINSRYRFLLDEARFFIEGFIKGPVCRGQVSLNVIDDQFWIFFFNPDQPILTERPEFLDDMVDYLKLPAGRQNTLNILAVWSDYWRNQQQYLKGRSEYLQNLTAKPIDEALTYVWDGGGTNPNAALTVFRNFDSASVAFGLLGDYPETAWILDYPVFERIHYLLVAGFDVFGNVGHQLNTRLYMEFLRMESENYFLMFLPAEQRRAIRDSWYVGIRESVQRHFREPTDWMDVDTVTGFNTDDVQRELYQRIQARLGPMAGPLDHLNRCDRAPCTTLDASETQLRIDKALRRIASVKGAQLKVIPDVLFMKVRASDSTDDDLVYTLVHNKGYKNLTSQFEDESNRDLDDDTVSVVPGFIGAYPNFFFVADAEYIEEFADRFVSIFDRDAYERFVALYGVRRTNPRFWSDADWFQSAYLRDEPIEAGIFDLNRYRNR
jgi:hypothetical protein